MELIEAILKVSQTEAGQRALLVLFAEHGVPQDKLNVIISQLPEPKPPQH